MRDIVKRDIAVQWDGAEWWWYVLVIDVCMGKNREALFIFNHIYKQIAIQSFSFVELLYVCFWAFSDSSSSCPPRLHSHSPPPPPYPHMNFHSCHSILYRHYQEHCVCDWCPFHFIYTARACVCVYMFLECANPQKRTRCLWYHVSIFTSFQFPFRQPIYTGILWCKPFSFHIWYIRFFDSHPAHPHHNHNKIFRIVVCNNNNNNTE